MKKFIFLLPVLFMLLVQNQTLKAGDTTSVTVTDSVGKPVYEVIDSIFRPLDRSAMNTEFLGTKAFSLVNHELYNGALADSNYVTYGNMWALYGFWATACTDSNYNFAYDSLQGYKQTLKAHRDSGYVPLTLTVGQYNELKDSAIADSLIRYKNGQLEDIANRPANPYKTQYLAAGSPAMRSIAAYPVTYRIPDALITGPLRDSISQLYINFGDSAGYRTVQTGTEYGIDYADTGQKTLTSKVVLTRCSRFAITNNSGADLKSALAQGAFNTAPAKGFPCANLHFRKKERETFPQ